MAIYCRCLSTRGMSNPIHDPPPRRGRREAAGEGMGGTGYGLETQELLTRISCARMAGTYLAAKCQKRRT